MILYYSTFMQVTIGTIKTSEMGRHSIQQKRRKRMNQKRKKRSKRTSSTDSHSCDSTEYSSNIDHDILSELGSEASINTCSSYSTTEGEKTANPVSGDELSAPFDRLDDDNDQYWDQLMEEKINEFDSYHDAHPCIVTDKRRSIKVFVDGSGPYKNTAGLTRVDMECFIGQLMKRDTKATEVCRSMRDGIETLEGALKDSKIRMMKIHRECQRKIEKVRYFWRNKIYEGNSRGGELLKAALIYPDMYS